MKAKKFKRIFHLSRGFAALLTLGMEVLVGTITYLSGGTEFPFTHLMYIPIILAAYYLDLWGAISFSVIGGLILGLWIPMDVGSNIAKVVPACIFRTCMFLLVGIVVALMLQLIKTDSSEQLRLSNLEAQTGLSNLN